MDTLGAWGEVLAWLLAGWMTAGWLAGGLGAAYWLAGRPRALDGKMMIQACTNQLDLMAESFRLTN